MWEMEGVSVRFGRTVALDDVSLRVDDGEIVVVLGPSGCGKSTLLRTLVGLQRPADGRVLIDGVDAAPLAPHRRGIGMMFQDHALFPHRDVAGNVEFGLRMAGLAPAARAARVGEMLALVGLAGYERRDVGNLSGGEAQRVALARSLAPGPRLLLLDEPLGSLDRELRDRLVEELPGVLRASATAAVHVTHDHDEAFALADRITVMNRGRVLRDGPPAEVWADPRDEEVARFLGHRNVVDGPRGRRVIRVDAATIDPRGDVAGVVTSSRFLGDHFSVALSTADLGQLEFRLPEGVAVGEEVRLRIDPARTAPVD